MARARHEEDLNAGQDSFLDVITNIVGILIILVMVVGARVHKISLTAHQAVAPTANADLEAKVGELESTLLSAESEIDELQAQARMVGAAAEGAASARLELATAVSAAKVELERRKQAADAAQVAFAERAAKRRACRTGKAAKHSHASVVRTNLVLIIALRKVACRLTRLEYRSRCDGDAAVALELRHIDLPA